MLWMRVGVRWNCASWNNYPCSNADTLYGFTRQQVVTLMNACPVSCTDVTVPESAEDATC